MLILEYPTTVRLILFDLSKYWSIPIQTYFNTNPDGFSAICITTDSKYIATLSATLPQVLSIWEWTTESEQPVCSVELSADCCLQKLIRFNIDNNYQLITNGDSQTIFFEWSLADGLKYFAPQINDDVSIFCRISKLRSGEAAWVLVTCGKGIF